MSRDGAEDLREWKMAFAGPDHSGVVIQPALTTASSVAPGSAGFRNSVKDP